MSTACPQASNHEGNKEAAKGGRPNPIVSPAEGGTSTIRFPHHHLMTQWNKNEQYMGRLGRLGDAVGFASLPTSVQTVEMANLAGALSDERGLGAAEACGSPGETNNDPSKANHFGLYMTEYENGFSELYDPSWTGAAKGNVWITVVTRQSATRRAGRPAPREIQRDCPVIGRATSCGSG